MENTYLDFYKKINIQKQIDILAKKYQNKKILIYGAGQMSCELFENFDLSKLSIIGVCDAKYKENTNQNFFSYPAFSQEKLKELDFDVVLVNLRKTYNVSNDLKYRKLINTKNENAIVETLFKFPPSFLIREILF